MIFTVVLVCTITFTAILFAFLSTRCALHLLIVCGDNHPFCHFAESDCQDPFPAFYPVGWCWESKRGEGKDRLWDCQKDFTVFPVCFSRIALEDGFPVGQELVAE